MHSETIAAKTIWEIHAIPIRKLEVALNAQVLGT